MSAVSGRDTFHQKHPETNEWMGDKAPSVPGRRTGTGTATETSAQVERLASRLGADPDELAKSIPADTLRRTKYPVVETVNADGTRSFKHDRGIEDGGRKASVIP